MARRTKEEALKTRERILDAAIEVFYSRGVATPSLTDVAKLADVTRGAVYGHFRNKADVFDAMCDRIKLPIEAACGPLAPDQCSDPLGALLDSWIGFLAHTARDEQQSKILAIIVHRCELLEENGLIFERIRQGRENGLRVMGALLQHAVKLGQLPARLDIDRALTFFHSSVSGLLSEWLFAPESFDLAAVAPAMVGGLIDVLRLSPALQQADAPALPAADAPAMQ